MKHYEFIKVGRESMSLSEWRGRRKEKLNISLIRTDPLDQPRHQLQCPVTETINLTCWKTDGLNCNLQGIQVANLQPQLEEVKMQNCGTLGPE
jgi:hypothetical protein